MSRPRVSVTRNLLRPLYLLAGVEAPGCAGDGVSGADGLRVDQAGARLGIAAVSLAHPVPQCVVDALDGAVVVPPGEVPVHRLPGWEVLRQLPPGAPGPYHVEDRVHDPTPRMLLPPPALRSHPRRRQQRLHQRPLLVRQVRRIPTPRTTHGEFNEYVSPRLRQISNAV